jgi:phosphoserine phosphatase RsbU/P
MRISWNEKAAGTVPAVKPPPGPGRTLPSLPLDLHAYSRPARTFTGDFYFTHYHDGGFWIVLGDVAGKGLPAAVTMAMIQEELEHRLAGWVAGRRDPAAIMASLHLFLEPLLPANRFATAVVGHLRDDGAFTLANAGHCAPLIARRDGTVEPLPSTGPVVGMLAQPRWSSVHTVLHHDEILFLYSDGLVETRSPSGREFGLSTLTAALSSAARSRARTAREVLDEILGEFDRHAAGAREDDLTLVVVNRPPSRSLAG